MTYKRRTGGSNEPRNTLSALVAQFAFSMGRGMPVLGLSVMLFFSATTEAQSTGPLGAACEATEGQLLDLPWFDDLEKEFMRAVRQQMAGDIRTYKDTLTRKEASAFSKRLRRLGLSDIDLLPGSLAASAKRALIPAFAQVFSQASLADYEQRLDRIAVALRALGIPPEPPLPSLDRMPLSCEGLRNGVASLERYQIAWERWESDLKTVAGLPPVSMPLCVAFSPERFATIATTVLQMQVPLIEIGGFIDIAMGSGGASAAEFLTATESLSGNALAIEARLKTLDRDAQAAYAIARPRFENLRANVSSIIRPAMLQQCEKERLEEMERASRPTPVPTRAPVAPPPTVAPGPRPPPQPAPLPYPPDWIPCTCPSVHAVWGAQAVWVNGTLYHPPAVRCP